jgi:hypothetical protein
MTSSAPQLAAAPRCALALRQLLKLADSFGFVAVLIQYVNGDGPLKILAWMEIPPAFSGVQNAHGSFQMTLLADAVSSSGGQFPRINDIAH